MGEYLKIHLPEDEIDIGLTPGPLEPAVFQTDFGKIGIQITNFHEEEWSIIESLSSDIFISDILQEFGMRTFEQQATDAEIVQIKVRTE